MPAALLAIDLVTLLFAVGIVVLVLSTLAMVLEMLPRRRSPGGAHHRPDQSRGARHGRPGRPYGGVPLSVDAARVLSVARQRADAKQAGVELGLVAIPPSPAALAPVVAPMLEPAPPLAAIGAAAPIPIGPITHEPVVQEGMVIDVEPRQEPRRVVRRLNVGESPSTEMVMELLQELAERDPERLAEILKEWLRSDLRRRDEEDEL